MKPSVLPKWAATATFPTPSSGKQNAGWKTGERPPAQYLNWLAWNTYLWLKWLDDGNVSFTDVQTATLEASGNATVGGTLGVTGATTLASSAVTGNETVGGTLGVTGLITATAGVTAAANQHVTVSGTGKFKHGTKTVPVIVQPNAATAPSITGVNMLGLATYYAITGIPAGARLLKGRATVIDSATGPTKLTLSFAFVDCSTPSSPSAGALGTGSQSAGTGASQNIETAAVTQSTTSGQNWYLLVNTATGAASCKVIAAEVEYDQP